MPVRDVLLMVAFLSTLPFCFFRPWVGLLVFAWIGYMNPHRLTWGPAYDFQFALVAAVVTLAGYLLTSDRKPFIWNRETLLVLALWGWFTVTTLFAVYPDAWMKWKEVSKILLMALLAVPLLQERTRVRALLLVIALSLGFYGLKGGLFVLTTGGQWMVLGPPDTFFAANTELALVLNMSVPISLYLAREEERWWLRLILWVTFGLSILAVPFTYSRGGFLGLAVVLAVLFLKARHRLMLIPAIAVGIAAFMAFAPQQWFSRIETLETYELDESANLRFMSWRVGYLIASDRPVLGGGFNVFKHRETYDAYMPEYPRAFGHDAHSIYFNMLGEHGWIGLGIFVLLVLFSFATIRRLRGLGRTDPGLQWISNYAQMIEACLIAYLVTGAFLSVAYFDLAYQLFALVGLLKGLALQARTAPAPAPVAIPAAAAVASAIRPRVLRPDRRS